MVHCLCALYKQIKKVDLQVVTVPAVADPHCGLQLVRPSGFEMSMVVPSSREKLKKALDDFAEKHGIQFTTTGTAVAAGSGAAVRQKRSSTVKKQAPPVAGAGGSPAKKHADPSPTKPASSAVAAASSAAGENSKDPLFAFLAHCQLPQYYETLKKQMADLDVLEVMDADDFVNFGISDKAEIATMRNALQNSELIESLKAGEAPAPSPGGGAAGGAGAAAEADDLDFDDDDLDVPTGGGGGGGGAAKKVEIDLDDLEDLDLDGPSMQSSTANFTIDLSDDDLDVPPPSKPAAKPISLSDDDDI
jgi:hypothetical protein